MIFNLHYFFFINRWFVKNKAIDINRYFSMETLIPIDRKKNTCITNNAIKLLNNVSTVYKLS